MNNRYDILFIISIILICELDMLTLKEGENYDVSIDDT